MRKSSSTNSINKEQLEQNCSMAYTISLIGGRWKLSILGLLLDNKRLRYNELKKKLNGISERMLAAQLKELESDGLINRIAYPEIPPKVEYELTPLGNSLKNILEAMTDWGTNRQKNNG